MSIESQGHLCSRLYPIRSALCPLPALQLATRNPQLKPRHQFHLKNFTDNTDNRTVVFESGVD
jgi:hypothetical protein